MQFLVDKTGSAPSAGGGLRTLRADMPGPTEGLHQEVVMLRRREAHQQVILRQFEEERSLAGLMQRDLLPKRLPRMEGAEVHALYRPVDVVSGDLYDVVRLDDHLVAILLVDATGHGFAAALLAAHTKQSLIASSPPDEVLARLNTDLLNTRLQECQFVAALYAVYDERSRIIRWARGGVPYPILVRKGVAPRQVRSEGPIVGADADSRFEVVSLRLEPGDTMIFHSDGLESLLLPRAGEGSGGDLDRTPWITSLSRQPVTRSLRGLEQQCAELAEGNPRADDLTLVALEVLAEPSPALKESEAEASFAALWQ